jgi:hypothetical protein
LAIQAFHPIAMSGRPAYYGYTPIIQKLCVLASHRGNFQFKIAMAEDDDLHVSKFSSLGNAL